jgi:hypothetical protein
VLALVGFDQLSGWVVAGVALVVILLIALVEFVGRGGEVEPPPESGTPSEADSASESELSESETV